MKKQPLPSSKLCFFIKNSKWFNGVRFLLDFRLPWTRAVVYFVLELELWSLSYFRRHESHSLGSIIWLALFPDSWGFQVFVPTPTDANWASLGSFNGRFIISPDSIPFIQIFTLEISDIASGHSTISKSESYWF